MNSSEKKLTGITKAMAKQMARSWEVPQFHLDTAISCEKMIAYRSSLPFKTSYTAILVKCVAETLSLFPQLNSSWNENNILVHDEINIGIAMDTKRGLLVPVIRNADKKTLEEIHNDLAVMKEKGITGKFTMDDLSESTFTISNLGMFNVRSFTAIVNAPNAAILSVGKMEDIVALRDGNVLSEKQMHLGLSGDHRVTDGATGAKFMTELAAKIENLA